jgi:probable phosphoglycerate mutase
LAQALVQRDAIDAIYASDLSRAHTTAQAIAQRIGQNVTTHAGLRERHFGAFQGRTFAEIEVELPEHAWHWRKRTPEWTPPDGGESLVALRERIVATVDELAARHPGQQVVMVAHGGVLDILYRAATRLDLQAPRTWALTNTAVNRLLWTPQGLSLVGWGDTTHLDTLAKDESSL